jgi:FAD/FMN-containing dehydrogenase
MRTDLASWGRFPTAVEQIAIPVDWRGETLPLVSAPRTVLPFGMGRSYGDSCLNDRGGLLLTRGLDKFISFEVETGILKCESGVTLDEILRFAVPRGWFIPVSPGTRFVTLGGAVANDVHGKNHHRAGTFGMHIRSLELLRSDGSRLVCSLGSNPELFAATVGGLGLTGLITWVEVALKRIESPWISQESVRFGSLMEYFPLCEESDRAHEYTVAWIDCLAPGKKLGRGILYRGDHAPAQELGIAPYPRERALPFPIEAPEWLLSRPTMRAFNLAYYRKQLTRLSRRMLHYERFFYPLDSIANWNRMYGRRGFFQYQCVVPARAAAREILERVARSREGSFLTVLKTFGDAQSPGMLSFPRKGFTLSLDFPNRGRPTLELLDTLDDVVAAAGGAVYPAKDARMSPDSFKRFFPEWERFADFVDPRFSSSFWRRVTA